MAGKHIAEANAATIEALHKILEVGVNGGILIVDSVKGNDIKAASDASIPFATITAAKTEATAGKTIIVMPGTYDEGNLAKDGINYYFMPGAKVIYTGAVLNTCIFADNDTAITLNVYGYGEFINNGTGGGNDVVHTEAVGTIFNIECIKMHSEINRAVGNDEATVTIRCKEISSGDGVIDTAGGTNGNAKTIIYADKIEAFDSYAIEHDGGIVKIYANEIIANSDMFACITTNSGDGELFIVANKLTSAFYGLSQLSLTTTIYLKNIHFDCVNTDISGDSVAPELITVDNCKTVGNIPYLKGIAGLNYLHKNSLTIGISDTLIEGYEPDELKIKTGEIGSGITELIFSVPEKYMFKSGYIIDKVGNFLGLTAALGIASDPVSPNYIASLGYLNTIVPFTVNESNTPFLKYLSNIYFHAYGDGLTGCDVILIFERVLF